MGEEQLLVLEPVTREEVDYAAEMLCRLVYTNLTSQLLLGGVDQAAGGVEGEEILISLQQIDLEVLSNLLGGQFGGWTDPIGQLGAWIHDRLKELSSWFASTVEGIFRRYWDTLIRPALLAITAPITGIQSWTGTFTTQVFSAFSGLQSAVTGIGNTLAAFSGAISRLGDTINSAFRGAVDAVTRGFSDLGARIGGMMDSISRGLADISTRFSSAVQSLTDTFVRTLSDAVTRIGGELGRLRDAFTSSLAGIASSISQLGSMVSRAADAIAAIPQLVSGAIQNAIQGAVTSFQNALASLADSLGRAVASVREDLGRSISGIGDWVREASQWLSQLGAHLSKVGEYLNQVGVAFTGFTNSILRLPDMFIAGLQRLFADPFATLKEIGNALIRFLLNPWAGLMDLFQRLASWVGERIWALMPDWMKNWLSGIGKIWEGIANWLSSIRDAIVGSLSQLSQWLWERLPDWLRNALSSIGEFFSGLRESLAAFWKDPIGFLQARFQELSQWLWERVPEWMKKAGEAVSGFIDTLRAGVESFLKDPIGALRNAVWGVWQWIWERLPDWAKAGIEAVSQWFSSAWEWIKKLKEDPFAALKSAGHVALVGLGEALRAFWSGSPLSLREIGEWMWEKLVEFGSWLWERVKGVGGRLWSMGFGFLGTAAQTAMGMFGAVFSFFSSILRGLLDSTKTVFMGLVPVTVGQVWSRAVYDIPYAATQQLTEAAFVTEMIKYSTGTFAIMALSMLGYVPAAGLGWTLRSWARAISAAAPSLDVSVEPVGVGMRVARFNPLRALAASLEMFGRFLMEYPEEAYRSMLQGFYTWSTEPLARLVNSFLRNFLPVKIPAMTDITEILVRMYAVALSGGKHPLFYIPFGTSPFLSFRGVAKAAMALSGYPDYFVDAYIALPDEFHVKFRDRFNVERMLPLGLMWAVPSLSDMLTFYVRDIFASGRDFMAAAASRGLTPDVAALYYMARFKYPSPEKLALFYWRGIAGVLWLPDTFEETEPKQLLNVGAKPKPPAALNFDAKTLNDMIAAYMKWHDYFPLAWSEGYPTDKSIVVELTADLPDKADLRWMTKWGVLEHLSALGLQMTTPITQITELMRRATGRELIGYIGDQAGGGEITYDVRLLARLLEARGLHPYFTPLASVAESQIALADELTMLRTGFIGSYREGLLTLSDASRLMSGLFYIKFLTGYIDPSTGRPVEVEYRKPLFWLPAEQRLLLLRAVFDRFVDLMRDMVREASSAVRRLGLKPVEAANIIKSLYKDMVEHVSDQVRRVTGVDWTPRLDEDYLRLWIRYGELAQLAEIRTWIRNYATRLMAWIMYRLSYGWVEPEEFKKMVEILTKAGWITEEEGRFFIFIMENVLGMVRREMVPTPLTLASMAEYMSIPDNAIDFVLNFYRVPLPEETGGIDIRSLYRMYIRTRPFMDDVRTLVTAYYRAKRYMVSLPPEVENRVRGIVKRYGFTDEELEIRDLAAHIQYLTDVALGIGGEVYPTLSALSTLSEYVEIPMDYLLKVLTIRRVEPTYAQLWLKYMFAKQISAEVNAFVSNVKGLLERYAVPQQLIDQIKTIMRLGGWSDAEIFIFDWDVGLRRFRRILDTLVPSLRQLIGDSLYVGQFETLLRDWAATRGIDPEVYKAQLEYYMKLARNRAVWRQVSYYRTRLVTAYAYGILNKDQLREKLNRLKDYGLTDDEIELLVDAAEVYRMQRVGIRWNLVRSYWETVIEAYMYGAITDAELERLLMRLLEYGLTETEVRLLIEQARTARRMAPFILRR
ncbi:MAG: hypothetical protein QW794_00015 [Thermosphaera sp.]